MKKLRILILVLLSPLFVALMGAWGGLSGCGATATNSALGLDAPVDIPVTISKLLDGVDASSLQFTSVDSTSSLITRPAGTFQGPVTAEVDAVVGILHFYLIDHKCTTVGVIINGAYTTTLSSSIEQNCNYQLTITESMVVANNTDNPISLVVFGPGTTMYNSGIVSEPVICQIYPPDELTEEYTLAVINSNISSTSSDSTQAADMLDSEIAFSTVDSTRSIVFSALDIAGAASLWSVPVEGGSPEQFVTIDTGVTTLQQARENGGDYLYLIDQANNPFVVNSLGTATPLALTDLENPTWANSMSIDPTGAFVAFVVDGIGEDGNPQKGVSIYDVAGANVFTTFNLNGGAENGYFLEEIAWMDSNTLIASLHNTADDTKVMSRIGMDQVLYNLEEANGSDLDATLLVTGAAGMSNLITDAGFNVYYNCSGNLCRYSALSETNETLLSLSPVLIKDNFKISGDKQSYIVFETVTEPPRIGVYSIETGDVGYPLIGTHPTPSLIEDNLVAYQVTLNGTRQIAIANLENNITANPTALSFANPVTALSTITDTYAFTAIGGRPPYSYSVIFGNGAIDNTLGLYEMSVAGSDLETLQVTDSNGDTSTTSFEVPSGIAVAEFGSSGFAEIDFTNPSNETISDMVQQSDGKVVIVGRTDINGSRDMLIARYTVDGELDPTFNATSLHPGMIIIDVGNAFGIDELTSVGLLSDGSIIAAGSTSTGGFSDAAFVLADTDGIPISTFGPNGVSVPNPTPGINEGINDLEVGNADEIIVVGYVINGANGDMLAMKVEIDGTLDSNFGTAGTLIMDVDGAADIANSVMINDIKFYITGTANVDTIDQCVLTEISTATGALNTSFGNTTDGFVLTNSATATTCNTVMRTQTTLYTGGSIKDPDDDTLDWFVRAYESNGATYSSVFGDGDSLTLDIGSENGSISSMISTGSDLSLVLVGSNSNDDSAITLARIDEVNGTIRTDTSFGNDGIESYTLTGTSNNRTSKMLLSNYRNTFLIGGKLEVNGINNGFIFELWP